MRIAVVHSYYSSRVPSGENTVVDAQVRALRSAGHEVIVVEQSTDRRLRRRTYPLEAAATAASGYGPSPLADLRRVEPDVVHVHNLFPNFGKTWLRHWDGPMVATLHNYRPLCPASTLFREGHVCRKCPTAGSAWPGVRHGCFHGSSVTTLPVALGTRFDRDEVLQRADVVTTLSEGMSQVYADHGVPATKLVAVDNFAERVPVAGPGGDYWLFAGRVEPEKGLHALIPQWPVGHRLLVAGDPGEGNPLPPHPDVSVLGHVPPDQLRALMANARGLVFPSVWLEGLALVCLEALSVGTPILTFDDIPAGRAVADLGVGLAVPRDGIAGAVADASSDFAALRERCLEAFGQRFTPAAWLARIETVYARALASPL
jgi:glycosyltransferase involved in cell wall biosynthesis